MQVLTANPDIHTLWNIRRECVHSLVSGQVSAQLLGGVQHNFPSIQSRHGLETVRLRLRVRLRGAARWS